ncbi:DesA family fatty acid desaturase [Comamonas composti]|uniref:DesA family fatty acid desaturase n=1 Tax=Comamonas composti TaxID=408558 RepID=UPI00040C3DA3|nr:fatty acid desaturase [Comamonas composti]
MSLDIGWVWNTALDWMAHGLWQLSWWQLVLYALVTTHITIAGVTIFLHRSQAHRSLELGPVPSHFFRLWLWLGTGMVTKQWVAIHRKHHAKCETVDDPHSPQTRGLITVLARGAELYRSEAANEETLKKFGHGTPDDWLERHLYSRRSIWGPSLMLVINVLLFGAIGLTIWAVQMAWIPFWAAGVVNGLGHFWGYRNFEAADASTNLVPWGLIIGGEELHNNHHTYPTSAKFSVKRYEFDLGWTYIRAMQALGWAKVKKTPPRLRMGAVKPVADEKTLEAVIANRYEVMAGYARGVRVAVQQELKALKAHAPKADTSMLRTARRWLHRDNDKVPARAQRQLAQARAAHPVLDQMLLMREDLRQLWLNTTLTREQLIAHLQLWCQKAEASGIAALKDFSLKLRAAQA